MIADECYIDFLSGSNAIVDISCVKNVDESLDWRYVLCAMLEGFRREEGTG